eukprot:CAMPEP_0183336174 /NCGR_PEP_ID=MMETSP0164_2-20130417/4235_1 /TAXON_ID=221442 /ORGANISM="Coccolithus pelagicus ssp braarudi, Strain PLY182g" /LENGTH=46 /DNA_ID= /DNA_START= /DNA_END= /DNA_ORIENTATION=
MGHSAPGICVLNLHIDADFDSRAKYKKRRIGGDHGGGLNEIISRSP